MKKAYSVCLFCFMVSAVFSQTLSSYKIKAEFMYGTILKHDKRLKELVKGPAVGGEIAVEFQTMGEEPWHQYLNFPVIGVGAAAMDFGNDEMLGQGLALYPYMNIAVVKTNHFILNFKPGAGIAFMNKRYSNAPHAPNTLVGANSAIGSIVNVFLTCGGSIEIPLAYGISLTADYGWNHISNGNIMTPNAGINMLNGYAGLKYAPKYRYFAKPRRRGTIKDIPRRLFFEVSASGGIRQLYYLDSKNYGAASLSIGAYCPMANWYQMGGGADVFYDGVYGAVNAPADAPGKTTRYPFTYIEKNEFKNKIRAGISWHHEFLIGRLTAGFHFGLYLYDPVKNLEPYKEVEANGGRLHKPLIYKYDINKENGWLYTRAVAKYALTEHLFVSAALKTHLNKAEFITWGAGWKF